MAEENPSNAVLLAKLDALKDVVTEHKLASADTQASILEQVKKTNGRVGALEKWKNISTGVMMVLSAVVIPVLVALAINYLTNSK